MNNVKAFFVLWFLLFLGVFGLFNGIIVFVNWAPIEYSLWEPAGRFFYAMVTLLILACSAAISGAATLAE